jgi:hypothetical protein
VLDDELESEPKLEESRLRFSAEDFSRERGMATCTSLVAKNGGGVMTGSSNEGWHRVFIRKYNSGSHSKNIKLSHWPHDIGKILARTEGTKRLGVTKPAVLTVPWSIDHPKSKRLG